MNIIKVKDYQQMSERACERIKSLLTSEKKPVLGLATGSTPEGLYQCLIDVYQNNKLSFKHVTTFNLDEYIGLSTDHPNSYNYYMHNKLFKYIDIIEELAHLPNGMAEDTEQECRDYENLIHQAEEIDLQILGLGLNGHIGFNEPGTPFDTRTHVVKLDESTRAANARFFDCKKEVPTHAITMGIDTIMDSKEIVLLVTGEKKAEALNRLVTGEISTDFPASILKKHHNLTIIVDEPACRLI